MGALADMQGTTVFQMGDACMHAQCVPNGGVCAQARDTQPPGAAPVPHPGPPVRNPVFFLAPLPLRKDCQLSCFCFCAMSMFWKRILLL